MIRDMGVGWGIKDLDYTHAFLEAGVSYRGVLVVVFGCFVYPRDHTHFFYGMNFPQEKFPIWATNLCMFIPRRHTLFSPL